MVEKTTKKRVVWWKNAKLLGDVTNILCKSELQGEGLSSSNIMDRLWDLHPRGRRIRELSPTTISVMLKRNPRLFKHCGEDKRGRWLWVLR